MPITHPDAPDFASAAERTAWEHLCAMKWPPITQSGQNRSSAAQAPTQPTR